MSGALAERVFVKKISRVGFVDIDVRERVPFGLERVSGYPLFTPDLIALMRQLIPQERHGQVATSVLVTASRGAGV